MDPLHEKIIRATTALNVAVIEDINGSQPSRAIIKAMRDCQHEIAQAIVDLAHQHADRRHGD